ncbi:hypothetical protein EC957_003427 [Mortierella hygrophila]|uniref:Adhesin domain-containing protein n=1 Tax=Mortierella hygrophila TaxID=979708 RepID=A0A9P6F2W1_9FUNG|nr:hypothetical protein EC957_003427 [Mortierella hygrophila]
MSTGKQQYTNGQGNRDSTTVDIDHSPPVPDTDIPPPAYSNTPELGLGRPTDHDERTPLLGGGRVTSGRVATPAEAAARRATELGSRRRGGGDGTKRWFHEWKVILIAAIVGIMVIWGLIRLVNHMSYECKVPEDAQVATMEYSFDPADYRELFIHLDEGITGDISVSQSRDRTEGNITILITAQASTPELLSFITLKTTPTPRNSFFETSLFLDMKSSDIYKALARNCTRLEVDIIFPRHLYDYDFIQIESRYKGNVIVAMDPKRSVGARIAVERLELLARAGSVTVKDLLVTEAMNVVTKGGEGNVEAQVEVRKVARVQAKGDVSLTVESWSNGLDLKVDSSGRPQVAIKTPFYGHLWLKTISIFDGPPEFFASTCCFYERKRDNHTLVGYMSYNGYEPGYFPRIDIQGRNTRLDLLA